MRDEELAISGYLAPSMFCSSFTEIPVLPACDECNNTYPPHDQVSCKASLSQIREYRQLQQAFKQEALKRLYDAEASLNPAANRPIKRVQATIFFREMLESEQDVEEALSRLRDHLLTLVAEGARIRVE